MNMITGLDIRRKIVHLSTLIIPFGYGIVSKEIALTFLIPFFLCYLFVDLLRHLHPRFALIFQRYFFGKVLRENERLNLMGSTYFLFSTIITILLFPKSIAIVSLLILIISDTASGLVGKGIGRIRVFKKTLEGSLAFLLTSILIVWSYPGLDRFSGTLAALGATLIEVSPLALDDNLSIPLVSGSIMFFLTV